jgi:hypothetical protein
MVGIEQTHVGKVKGAFRLRIESDSNMENPREDDGNLGTMYHWHSRMNVGDERIERPYAEEEYDALFAEHDIVLPVYMHEHGGVALSTGSFSCGWDSGQVGFIATSFQKVREWWQLSGDEPIPDATKELAIQCLKGEVQAFDDYINGRGWGFTLEQAETCNCCENVTWEYIESCWGFTGDDAETMQAIGEHLDAEHMALLDKAWDDRGWG